MTTVTNTVAAKLFGAVAAVALLLSLFAPAVQAQTESELQQMINDLLAQVSSLQSQIGQGGTSVASGVCPYTWTRDLTMGSSGGDVMKLQQFLNADADTRVAATGVGSVGAETEYFGGLSAEAVSKFQVKYRSEILSPAGLVNPTGYFGPSTRAKANALCVSAPADDSSDMADDSDDADVDEDMDEDDDDSDSPLRGEADLDVFEVDDADQTDVQEGEEDVEIAVFTIEFEDGDAELSRLDIVLEAAVGNDEVDPWDVFETISLWVDGDMIAEKNADDEDDYLDEDEGSLRFTRLNTIARENDEVEIVVAATIQNNLDGVGPSDTETWTVSAQEMRYFDADGVATTDDSTDDLGGDNPASIDIEAEGEGEEIHVSLASSNPDASDIIVDTDRDTNGVTILAFDIEAEEGDIDLDRIVVKVVTSATTTTVVDDIHLELDGQVFDAESIGTESDFSTADDDTLVGGIAATGISEGKSETATGTLEVWYLFDIDKDVTIDEDDEITAELVVDLNSTDDDTAYPTGTTIQAMVTSVERTVWQAEGRDDLLAADFTGAATGDTHTLVSEGIYAPVDGFSSSVSLLGQNDTIGEFTLEFEVNAVEGDFYVTNSASTTGVADGVKYTVDGGAATIDANLTSTADEETTNVFTVREGESETFTLVVTVDPAAAGTFRVQLDEIWYSTNTDGATGAIAYTISDVTEFRSDPKTINN